jgi:hypothetical protein
VYLLISRRACGSNIGDFSDGILEMRAHDPSKQSPDVDVKSTQSQERDRIAAFLEGMVPAGASSQDIAEAVAAAFRGIDQALMPIVGVRGVAALYKRSLHLARLTHPWLPHSGEGVATTMDLAALTTDLAKHTADDAAAAGVQLLHTFHGLLSGLIGPSLTERLLRPVWATFLSGRSARDTTP